MPADFKIAHGKRSLPARPSAATQLERKPRALSVNLHSTKTPKLESISNVINSRETVEKALSAAKNTTNPRESVWDNLVRRKVDEYKPRSPKLNKWNFLRKANSSSNLLDSTSISRRNESQGWTPGPLKRALSVDSLVSKPIPQEQSAQKMSRPEQAKAYRSSNLLDLTSRRNETQGWTPGPLKRGSSVDSLVNKPISQKYSTRRVSRLEQVKEYSEIERHDHSTPRLVKQRSMEFIDAFRKFEGNDAKDFAKISKERKQLLEAQAAKRKEDEAIEKCFQGLDELRLFLRQMQTDFKQIRVKCAIIKHDLSDLRDLRKAAVSR